MADLEQVLEEETFDGITGKDAIIFLIDASAPMFVPTPDQDSDEPEENAFVLALRCAHSTLCSKILIAENDSVGIVLFGTSMKDSNEKYGSFSNTYVLLDLQKPECEPIMELEKTLEGGVDKYKVLATEPPALALGEALWLCTSMFNKQKQKYDSKTIFLFTNNDQPHSILSDQHKQAERRVSDLQEGGNSIVLFPIGSSFDINKFFKDLLADQENSILPNSTVMDDLLTKICRRSFKKRVVAKLVFRLDSDVKFSVKLYNLVRPTPMPKHINIDQRTNEPVKTITTKFNAETAEVLLPSEVVKYTVVADKKIRMEKEDLKSVKSKFPTGFTLLGFKPLDSLKFHLYVNPASFIYHDDETIKGSRTLFGALLNRCEAKKVAVICSLKITDATKPRVVALLPETNEEKNPDFPTLFGFHVIYLPYLNDVRVLDYESVVGGTEIVTPDGSRSVREIWRADREQVEAAKAIVKKMSMKNGYIPTMFENPALRTKWKIIEGIALGRSDIEKSDDMTQPDVEDIDRRLGPRAGKFLDLIFPIGYLPQGSTKPKSKATGVDLEQTVESADKSSSLNKLTVDQLKGYLSSQGIGGISGKKKADLLNMVRNHLKK